MVPNSNGGASPDIYKAKPLKLSQDFTEQCAGNSYYIKPDATGFCRDSVFSLATEFNNGALPCGCHNEGSTSYRCQEFGGQCPCRPFVIGRACTRCKIGYYGFPNCRRKNIKNLFYFCGKQEYLKTRNSFNS